MYRCTFVGFMCIVNHCMHNVFLPRHCDFSFMINLPSPKGRGFISVFIIIYHQ
nr:MAG TPA: hypothetical protein [Caudoviricetes sp.]